MYTESLGETLKTGDMPSTGCARTAETVNKTIQQSILNVRLMVNVFKFSNGIKLYKLICSRHVYL